MEYNFMQMVVWLCCVYNYSYIFPTTSCVFVVLFLLKSKTHVVVGQEHMFEYFHNNKSSDLDDEVLSGLKRTCVADEISSAVNDKLLFVGCFFGTQIIYHLIDKMNMTMIAVKVGENFIVLEKSERVNDVLRFLESVGLERSQVLFYEIAKKKPLNFGYISFSLEELQLDFDYMSVISKSNIQDYRHCICLQRAFACFVIPLALPDWKNEIARLLDKDADGPVLDSYTLPSKIAEQWGRWECTSDVLCSQAEIGIGNMDVVAIRRGISILRRKSIPRTPMSSQSRRFYSTVGSMCLSRNFSTFAGQKGTDSWTLLHKVPVIPPPVVFLTQLKKVSPLPPVIFLPRNVERMTNFAYKVLRFLARG